MIDDWAVAFNSTYDQFDYLPIHIQLDAAQTQLSGQSSLEMSSDETVLTELLQDFTPFPVPTDLLDWMLDVMHRLDAVIDLDFYFLGHHNGSHLDIFFADGLDDLRLYQDHEQDDAAGVLGLAIPVQLLGPQGFLLGRWWEILFNATDSVFEQDHEYLRYAFLHELGHALGLEHPFSDHPVNADNDLDGDLWGYIQGPPFADETVMAYAKEAGSSWPQFFSPMDLVALASIWGLESDHAGDWLFQNVFLSESYTYDAATALDWLALDQEFQGLVGPVPAPLLPPPELLPLSSDSLLSDGLSFGDLELFSAETIFYSLTDALLSDPDLVAATSLAIAQLDLLIDLDFQHIDELSHPLVQLVFDKQPLTTEQLDADLSFGLIASESLLATDSLPIGNRYTIAVDSLNPFYRNQDSYSSRTDFLEHALLQQLLIVLGLQPPWEHSGSSSDRYNTEQTLLARRIDQPLQSPQLTAADQDALISRYGLENNPDADPLSTQPGSLVVGDITASIHSDTVRLSLPIERSGSSELSAFAELRVLGYGLLDPSSAADVAMSSFAIDMAPGQSSLLVQADYPVGAIDFIDFQLHDRYLLQPLVHDVHVPLHELSLALEPAHLVNSNDGVLLKDQGSDLIVYSFSPDLPLAWQSVILSYLSTLDAALEYDFVESEYIQTFTQLFFDFPSSSSFSLHQNPSGLLVGDHYYPQQPFLTLSLPSPADDAKVSEHQQAELLQHLLLCLGLEHPADASDGDVYDLTPVLPTDSAMFNHSDGIPPLGQLQELDWAALALLHPAESATDAARSSVEVPELELLLLEDLSGAVNSDTSSLTFELTRSQSLELTTQFLLEFSSTDTTADFSHHSSVLRFLPGEDLIQYTVEIPRQLTSSLEVAIYSLAALRAPESQFISSSQLRRIADRSIPTADAHAPTDLSLSQYEIFRPLQVSAQLLHLSASDPDTTHFDFSLAPGPGDDDNALFSVDGNHLVLLEQPSGPREDFSIRLAATDSDNLFIERSFTLPLIDGPPSVLPLSVVSPAPVVVPDLDMRLSADVVDHPSFRAHTEVDVQYFFDSSRLSVLTDLFTVQPDVENLDHDPHTDQYLTVTEDFSALPPYQFDRPTTPLTPLDLRTSSLRFDPITGSSTSLNIHGVVRSDDSLLFQGQTSFSHFNLDVNGDGVVGLYSDGIALIRTLIGLDSPSSGLFPDTTSGSTRSAAMVDQFLLHSFESGLLDFDQDGMTRLYSDGVLLIRHLIDPALVLRSGDLLGSASPFQGDQGLQALSRELSALHPPDS